MRSFFGGGDAGGSGGGASVLGPRWWLLRGVGLVYLVIFSGILRDGLALNGPGGLLPAGDYLRHVAETTPGGGARFLAAPSGFWLGSGDGMILGVAGLGLAAAAALTLNLWPRLAVAVCWATFLSFVAVWRVFSGAQLDRLMLEAALLCIPFAPRGFRPGLGTDSPPRPLVVFMVRCFLLRVMFESGLVKLTAGDPHWRDFSAMDIMYETSPFPTIFGYLDHHLSRTYHVGEILFTFFVELGAPVLAVFGGRRGRWIAFASWTVFQLGIQLTNNFGWLNVASIALGVLLLDDAMLAAAGRTLRLNRLPRWPWWRAAPVGSGGARARVGRWRGYALGGALWAHFALAAFFFAKAAGVRVYDFSPALTKAVHAVTAFDSANEYSLYGRFVTERFEVEFLGSNDGGRTWRTYEYRHLPQAEDRLPGFIAPHFVRFDASLQIAALKDKQARIYAVVASHLLQPNPAVVALFRANPFPDRPPTAVRMRAYRLSFTASPDAGGGAGRRYWTKELLGDFLPAMRTDAQGRIAPFDLAAGDAELRRGNASGARAVFEAQFQAGDTAAGYRLVDLYSRGLDGRPDLSRAMAVWQKMATEGELAAASNLGVSYENGFGTAVNVAEAERWYRVAARRGHLVATFRLGLLRAGGAATGREAVEALALLLKAGADAQGGEPAARLIREQQPAEVRRLEARLNPAEIAAARRWAETWPQGDPR